MFNWLRKLLTWSKKSFGITSQLWTVGGAEANITAQAAIDIGYCRNSFVFDAQNQISDGVGSLPYQVTVNGGDPLEKGDNDVTQQMIDNGPNQNQGWGEFNSAIASWLLTGDAYIKITRGLSADGRVRGVITNMQILPSLCVMVEQDQSTGEVSYKYHVGNGQREVHYHYSNESGDNADIIHIKTWNPNDQIRGLSPLIAAGFLIRSVNEGEVFNLSMLEKGAVPSSILQFLDDSGPGEISKPQREQLEKDFNSKFSGSQNAGKPVILPSGMDIKQIGLSPADMSFRELQDSAGRRIYRVLGVPPILGGLQDATFNNMAEAKDSFWIATVLPLAAKINAELSKAISHFAGKNKDIVISVNLDEVPAIQRVRMMSMEKLANIPTLSINEKRIAAGRKPLPGKIHDVVFLNPSQFPATEMGDAAEMPEIQDSSDGDEDAE